MIIIYGGTFDPVHLGHLRLAEQIIVRLNPDEFRFLPCYQPVHKSRTKIDVKHRIAMLKLAINSLPASEQRVCSIDDRELKTEQSRYSIDTLQELRTEQGKDEPLVFVMGADSLHQLHTWHRWKELSKFVHFLIISRPGYPIEKVPQDTLRQLKVLNHDQADWLCTTANGYSLILDDINEDISSSEIRNYIKDHKKWLSLPVYDYIFSNHLYNSQP